MAHRTVGAGQSITTSGSAAKSDAIAVKSSVLRITARDEDAHVAIGTEPTATVTDYIIPAGTSETLGVTKASQRVRTIESSGTKTIVICIISWSGTKNVICIISKSGANKKNCNL